MLAFGYSRKEVLTVDPRTALDDASGTARHSPATREAAVPSSVGQLGVGRERGLQTYRAADADDPKRGYEEDKHFTTWTFGIADRW